MLCLLLNSMALVKAKLAKIGIYVSGFSRMMVICSSKLGISFPGFWEVNSKVTHFSILAVSALYAME